MVAAMATRAEVTESLARLCHLAKREMAVVGTTLMPTPWDLLHIRINAQLDRLDVVTRGSSEAG